MEANSTVHLVRSQTRAPEAPAPATSSAPAAPASPFGPLGGAGGAPGSNPLADMMGSMGAMGGAGGMDINRMQQQLMSNPEMMASIMNSPMMEVRSPSCYDGNVYDYIYIYMVRYY